MSDKKQIRLTQLTPRQRGKVAGFEGGYGMIRHLEVLGIREGKSVTLISSMLARGPLVVQVDNSQIAIGYGMARRIWVTPSEE